MKLRQQLRGTLLLKGVLLVAYGVLFSHPLQAAPEVAEPGTGGNVPVRTGSLQEVIITAERRAQSIQDVPAPVAAIPQKALRDSAIDSVKLLAGATPGISISAQSSSVVPYIRGIGTQFALPGLESSVAMYMDDVYLSRTSAGFLAFTDIERVEVLKGPQGVLYGRNNTGGAIRLISKDTTASWNAGAALSAGNFGMRGGDGYVSGPITDTLQFRVAGQYVDDDGWLDSVLPGAPNMESRNLLLTRGKLKFLASDRVTLTLAADYARKRDTTGLGNLPLFTRLPASLGAAVGGIVDPAGLKYSGNVGSINNNVNKFRSTMWGAELRADIKFDGFTLTSITGYRFSDFRGPGDLDATSAQVLSADQRAQPARDFSEELQAVSHGDDSLKWTAGLYYWHERARQDTAIVGIVGLPAPNNTVLASGVVGTDSLAAYGHVTYRFARQWEMELGGRVTRGHRSLRSQNLYISNEDWTTGNIQGPVISTGSQSLPDFYTTQFNPMIGVDWRPMPGVMLYLSYSNAFKAGGYNAVGVPQSVDPLRNERITAYEAGWKSQWGRVRFNGDYFHYQLKDLQVLATSGFGSFLGARNAASAAANGAEVDLTVAASNRLEFGAALGWLDAKFDDFPGGQRYLPCSDTSTLIDGSHDDSGNCTADSGLGLGFVIANLRGNTLPLAPRWTGRLRASYLQPLGNLGTLTATLVGIYSDAFSFSPDNLYRQPAFQLLNGSLAWRSASGHFAVELSGSNLTNETYYTFKNTFQLGGWKSRGRPREYSARISYAF